MGQRRERIVAGVEVRQRRQPADRLREHAEVLLIGDVEIVQIRQGAE